MLKKMATTLLAMVFLSALMALAASAAERAGRTRPTRSSIGRAISRDFKEGRISRGQALLHKAQALFKEEALPEKYRAAKNPDLPPRCGTTRLLELTKNWHELPEEGRKIVPSYLRPGRFDLGELVPKGSLAPGEVVASALSAKTDPGDDLFAPPYQYTYVTTNFLIKYSTTGPDALTTQFDGNSNGTPDLVEETGNFFEAERSWMIDHGWRQPIGTDTSYYNVYFADIDGGTLGYTDPIDWPNNYSRSYIVLRSDFSDLFWYTPLDWVRATSAHEYMHACQFSYDANEDWWWMDASSVWVEDQIGPAWDATNVYVDWVSWFLFFPEEALDSPDASSHRYADVLWVIFLQEHLDPDGSIVREIWEACEGWTNALQANKNVIASYLPGGFAEAFQDFLLANYKADYSEASQFPFEYGNLWIDPFVYTYPTGAFSPYWLPQGLGSNYVKFLPPPGTPSLALYATFTPFSAGNWMGMLVGRNGGTYTRIDTGPNAPTLLSGFTDDYDEAVLIVTPYLANSYSLHSYSISAMLSLDDAMPPAPNPMTFSTPPHATNPSAISMTATSAVDVDNPPVKYQFEETLNAPGGTDTGWVTSRDHNDSGLLPNTRYGYRVRAADDAAVPNVGLWSQTVLVYTLCNTPLAPTLRDPAPTKLYITLGDDANPSNTQYSVYNATAGNYVGAGGGPAASAYWATKDTWNTLRITGLTPLTSYSFVVKARNGDFVETPFSPAGGATTLINDTTPPIVSGIATVPTWVKEALTSSLTVSATASDMATGGSDIVAVEYFLGADPGQGNATGMTPADGAFNSPLEGVYATLNVSTWLISSSPYDLYIRARDEQGLWGAPVHHEIEVVDGIPPEKVTDLTAIPAPAEIETTVGLVVSSVSSEVAGAEGSKAADGSTVTKWASVPTAEPGAEEITFDIASHEYFSRVEIYTSDRVDLFPAHFKLKLGYEDEWYAVVVERDHAANPGVNAWGFGARKADELKLQIVSTPLDTSSGLYRTEIAEIILYTESGGSRVITLSWSAPADTGPSGRAASYEVHYSTDDSVLSPGFAGTSPDNPAPTPAAPGTPQTTDVTGQEPGTMLYFALRSIDDYDNVSPVSNIGSAATLPDPNPYVALDLPADEGLLNIPTPPTFMWHANVYDKFKVQFSNVPDFPKRPYKDGLGRLAKTRKFGVKRGLLTFTPSKGQWKSIKKLASGMDGTLYWRVEARASKNRDLGTALSEVFAEYGFQTGIFENMDLGPRHESAGTSAVWPDNRPQFAWTVTNPIYATFYIDYGTSTDMNLKDRKNTYSIKSKNGSRTWLRPTKGQWKQIKKKLASKTGGLIYWRVRGLDVDKAFTAVSAPSALIIDSPSFSLREPAPRRDGTVHPEEPFDLEWGVDSEGYNRFRAQISISSDFPKGRTTINLRKVKDTAKVTVTKGQVRRLVKMLEAAGTDTFYWRVVATDVDNTMSAASDPAEAIVSVEPAIGGG